MQGALVVIYDYTATHGGQMLLVFFMVLGGFAAAVVIGSWIERTGRKGTVIDWVFSIGVLVYFFGGVGWAVFHVVGVHHLGDEDIRSGKPCTATVLSTTDTGNMLNHQRVLEFTLRVQPADGSAYQAKLRDTLNPVQGGRLGAGVTTYRCVIDRKKASRVEIFWNGPVATHRPSSSPTARR